jgi:L-ribulose-5-phosphate 3-epimerase
MRMTRKEFLRNASLAAAALAGRAGFGVPVSAPIPVCVFSKHLQFLDFQEMAEVAAAAGFDGVDLTVRPGGHISPEQVEEQLPRAVQAIREAGLIAPMVTTAITSSTDPLTVRILKTAVDLGIGTYRLGYFDYDQQAGVAASLPGIKRQLTDLAVHNQQLGIHGAYQNHSGSRFGAPVWDIWEAVHDLDPAWMGCQYDLMHAVAEGGNSWILGLDLLQKHVKSLAIKDFYWSKTDNGWQEVVTPLGEGMCNWQEFFRRLQGYGFSGPISLHFEYPMPEETIKSAPLERIKEETIKIMSKDLVTLKNLLRDSGLKSG